MPDVPEAEIINAELVEDLIVMPATVTPTAPSYALTRHTLLGPGEPPPLTEEVSQFTEIGFKVSEDVKRRTNEGGARNASRVASQCS
ncbi:hypothetical protein [Streptomyces virginiae]|uniref:hypothetical protein n=1 Tax=Streptomyces virginiae TaxID=1961 RepID=UPI003254F74A